MSIKLLPLLAAALLFSGCVPSKRYRKEQSRGDRLQAQVDQLAQQKAATEQNLRALQDERAQLFNALQSNKSELAQRVGELSNQAADLSQKLREAEQARLAEVARMKSAHDQLVNSLQGEIASGSIEVTQLRDKLSVKMVDKILFPSGSAQLKATGEDVLRRIAEVLNKVQDKDVRIEGHTDNVPIGGALRERYPTNWELSVARATNVVRFLQDKGNVDPRRLVAAGFSQYRPASSNDSEEGRAENRRIDIVLVAPESNAPVPTAAVTTSTP